MICAVSVLYGPSWASATHLDETTSTCGDTGSLPLETLGSDKTQRARLFQQAAACVREGKARRAITILSALIGSDPNDATANLNRGSLQGALGEKGLAMSDYSTAIGLQPDLVEAWYNRATTLAHLRQYELAIADFTEAIRLKPDLALAYCNRGYANFQLGRYDEALSDYTKAIGLDPRRLTYCYFSRGTFYLTIGAYQKAVEDLNKVIEQKPSDAVALSRRGQAYEGLGQLDEARDDFRAALEANPNLESASEGIGRLTEH
jgi:tetratricopeptide (TPR) repeat protein